MCLVLENIFAHNSLLNAVLKFGAPSFIKVFGPVSGTSLSFENNGVLSAIYSLYRLSVEQSRIVFHHPSMSA
jgi:hypothetical protein